jgi:hypothetical protein
MQTLYGTIHETNTQSGDGKRNLRCIFHVGSWIVLVFWHGSFWEAWLQLTNGCLSIFGN